MAAYRPTPDLPRARVLGAHKPDPGGALQFEAGDPVWIGESSPPFPGWLRVRTADGRSTWAPEPYVRGESGAFGRMAVDYDSTELAVQGGETVTVLLEVYGWAWVRTDDGREGWLPKAVLEFLPVPVL